MGKIGDELYFERDIKPLFNEEDRLAMEGDFDLWEYEDVREHAEAILEEVSSGRMPCYGAWPKERVEIFRRWVEMGKRA
jgi:hypothetical protein